jgi:hypothetical protein
MNLQRSFSKFIDSDLGGAYPAEPTAAESSKVSEVWPTEQWPIEETLSDLYPTVSPVVAKKHSAEFISNRLKVRQIAEVRLMHLSNELSKLADEVRYHHPLIAEVLDEAWDATEEALTLMNDSD